MDCTSVLRADVEDRADTCQSLQWYAIHWAGLTGYEFRSAKSSMRMASGLTMMKGNITKKPRARTSQGVLVRASNTAVEGRPLFFAMYS